MSHLLSIKMGSMQSNLVNLKSQGTRDLFDTSLQIRIHIGKLLSKFSSRTCCGYSKESPQ